MNTLLLSAPFKNVHFRPKTCYNGKVLLLAYIDSRDVMQRLDEVIGIENWQKDYKEVKGNLFCGIGIKFYGEWVWKWDCGTESDTEKEKGEASDSFKRAAVNWGIGQYLYKLKNTYVTIKDSGDVYIKITDKATGKELKGYYDIPKINEKPDYSIMPVGSQTGKKMDNIDVTILSQFVEHESSKKYPNHVKYANEIINKSLEKK